MSTDTKTQDNDKIIVNESSDGGAIVDLPMSLQAEVMGNQSDDTEEADAAQERAEIAATGRVDPDAEAQRQARRAKRKARKEYHKTVANEKDVKLQALERENRELNERLSYVERKTLETEVAKMEARIADEENRVLFAKQKMKEAAETGNGDLLVSAQDMMMNSSKELEKYKNIRQSVDAQRHQPQQQKIHPDIQKHAGDWLSNNPWYDPQGKDADSRRALNEDQILVDEGFDPRTPEYWEEFDKRLQNIIPHRYTTDSSRETNTTSRPRTVVTGSSRQTAVGSSSGNQFMLSRDQVNAMKDAGMWDDLEMRNRMIKRYAKESRINE